MDVNTEPNLSEDDILKWNAYARPLPLPAHMTPVSGAPLIDISDDVLMNAPPHMIVHVQRTASQGGMQVVSPRQTPFSCLMTRARGGARMIGDHIVGSTADPSAEWPTLDDANFDGLLPDEPLPTDSADRAVRAKTRTVPLTSAAHMLSDPILTCLIKGRAVIDLLRRDDVCGGADTFTEVLAKAWGIAKSEIDDLDAFTLGIDGPLLRHAIKADEVYCTMYAPVHVRRCISVGCSEVTRHYLPEDSAMDWRRMRVHCEAVFALAATIEGLPIKYMRAVPAPGDPTAPSDRPNIMCFQPSPATAWTFDANTFSLFPVAPSKHMLSSAIPADVLTALARYTRVVRPVSYAMSRGHVPRARKTTAVSPDVPYGETICDAYRLMVMGLSLGVARGKVAAASVRNLIYTALEEAPLKTRLRLTRYIRIAKTECLEHLQMQQVPDRLIQKIADKFLLIGDLIRYKVVAEAAKRGSSAEEWWSDILAQAPERYQYFVEGSKGWAMVGFWLLFREPTDRWRKLSSAVHYSALRDAEVRAICATPLPAEKGSEARLMAAARSAVKNLTLTYAGYYMGVADVGLAMSDVAIENGKPRTADMLKEAAYLWILRARALRGTNVVLIAKDKPTPSSNHMRISGPKGDLLLIPAPYRAYGAYQVHVKNSSLLSARYKAHIAEERHGALSEVFTSWGSQIYPVKATTLTLYLNSAAELGHDMEEAWSMLTQDMYKVMAQYGPTERDRSASPARKKTKTISSTYIEVNLENKNLHDYWTISSQMDLDEVEWIEDLLQRLGKGYEDAVLEGQYESVEDLRCQLQELDRGNPEAPRAGRESVR